MLGNWSIQIIQSGITETAYGMLKEWYAWEQACYGEYYPLCLYFSAILYDIYSLERISLSINGSDGI